MGRPTRAWEQRSGRVVCEGEGERRSGVREDFHRLEHSLNGGSQGAMLSTLQTLFHSLLTNL